MILGNSHHHNAVTTSLDYMLKSVSPEQCDIVCCRGRAERMAFADSFDIAYHFRLLYMARALMYPIMGAMRHRHGQDWQVRLWKASHLFYRNV